MGLLRAAAIALLCGACTESVEILTPPPGADGGQEDGGVSDADVPPIPEVAELGLAAGGAHACAIDDGELFCWGRGRDAPARVEGLSELIAVSAGETRSCAVNRAGVATCFEAPDGALETVSSTQAFVSLSGTYEHHCAITRERHLYCWGENEEGQLGQDDLYPGTASPIPLRVGREADWIAVGAGQGHTCGIRAPGTMWCWGRNSEDHLGQGSGAPIQIRRPVQVGREADWTAVSCSQEHSCGLRSDGSLWCWGNNEFGALGVGAIMRVSTPKLIMDGRTFVEVSANTFHTCGRDELDFVHCTGRNDEGQLANGDTQNREFFTETNTTKYARVAAGRFFTCAQRPDHRVECSGENNAGQLGVGDRTRRDRFTEQP